MPATNTHKNNTLLPTLISSNYKFAKNLIKIQNCPKKNKYELKDYYKEIIKLEDKEENSRNVLMRFTDKCLAFNLSKHFIIIFYRLQLKFGTAMTNKDIRWKQRFENFEKSFLQFSKLAKKDKLNEIEKIALIKLVEINFELSWKLLKDFLSEEGYLIKSPRDAIKTAFESGILNNGTDWLETLQKRNLSVHTYDDSLLNELTLFYKTTYLKIATALYNDFKNRK